MLKACARLLPTNPLIGSSEVGTQATSVPQQSAGRSQKGHCHLYLILSPVFSPSCSSPQLRHLFPPTRGWMEPKALGRHCSGPSLAPCCRPGPQTRSQPAPAPRLQPHTREGLAASVKKKKKQNPRMFVLLTQTRHRWVPCHIPPFPSAIKLNITCLPSPSSCPIPQAQAATHPITGSVLAT